MTLDYEAEYNNRARVPEHSGIFAQWARDAAAWRETNPPQTLRYGPSDRNEVDLFGAAANRGVVVFIHGGYWQAFDKSHFSHLAAGLCARGFSVAIPSYDLCPQVTLSTIFDQMRAACTVLRDETGRRLVVSGHSAGGHLGACLLAHEEMRDCVASVYAISGLFELEPLLHTSIDAALRLSPEEARRLSPRFWNPPKGARLDAAVGSEESAEFVRQSRDMVAAWGRAGADARFALIAGANHFTAIAPLADPASPMCARLAQLADNA